MKKTVLTLVLAALAIASSPAAEPVNTVCPVTGKPVDKSITWEYEGQTYAFAANACRDQFKAAREASLYHQLGGKAAIEAAVELFYTKVLADSRVNFYFDDVNMDRQRSKQKAFLSAALGGPAPWTGKDMRTAHKNLPGLNDSHFNAIAEHLQATLQELKVKEDLIHQVLALVETTRADVLNRPAAKP